MRSLFYFTAEWCTPCKKTKPIVEKMYDENKDFSLEIIDVDKNLDYVKQFYVSSVPTFVLFENEKEIKRTTGAKNEEQMRNFIYE
jgi:thioredoxin-like negative regulator of GroEL